jgi:hypothetical protein
MSVVNFFYNNLFHVVIYAGCRKQAHYAECRSPVRSAVVNHANHIYFFTKQATLMRRSNVLSFPLQFVFPALMVTGPSAVNKADFNFKLF